MTKKELTKKVLQTVSAVLAAVCLSLMLFACSERYLRTEDVTKAEIKGAYTLILYGGYYVNDIKTVAILVKEPSRYTFDVYAPDFDYYVIKGVDAGKALERAQKLVSFHHAFWKAQWRKIVDTNGEVIGYEVRPLYYSINFGQSNLIDVYYKKTDDKVVVYIRPSQTQQYMPFEGDKGFVRIK